MSTNIDKAVRFAASVGRKVQEPEMRARFAALPKHAFDINHVDILESAALATWHATMQHTVAQVSADNAQVPRELVDEAFEVKERMFKVAEYHLSENKQVTDELDDIRPGTGYDDLMKDLWRLSRLYGIHEPVLSRDMVFYRADDRQKASRLAHEIHTILGDGNDTSADYWAGQVIRTWSFLVAVYDEVSAAGRWLYRHEGGDELFPSLYATGRSERRGRPDNADEPGAPDTAGPEDAPAEEPAIAAG